LLPHPGCLAVTRTALEPAPLPFREALLAKLNVPQCFPANGPLPGGAQNGVTHRIGRSW